MNIHKETKKDCFAIRISATDNNLEVGRAWLYIIYNDLHKEPYGLLEDVFVEENQRNKGVGRKLVQAAQEEAKKIGCYKLIATTRSSRGIVCAWYEKLGFKNYGVEFRMDL
ncbi:MAG TPA: GNAT family N-acetyltransferase [Candidatus Udaeobacter sp.]|nr:GNAT family N-acetyltransferase [Candidatus Udaeobacter sp.]